MYWRLILFFVIIIGDSCVDRIDFNSPDAASQLVVEGLITDEPGPYFVKLTRTRKTLDFSATKTVSAIKVVIFDNVGNSEVLTETYPGFFSTKANGIRGIIGREYYVRIETRDGKIYESTPEKIMPAGSIDNLYSTFEEFQPLTGGPRYQFKIFMDTQGDPQGENLFRWKFNAAYRVVTNPELNTENAGQGRIPAPRSCSGFIFTKKDGLQQIGPCNCCTCWANIVDTKPIVSSNLVVSDGKFKGIEMGTVPVEYWTFFDKVLVEVTQLSISKIATDYWKTIRNQKDGSASLFQPSIGKAVSNVYQINGPEEVHGLFYAAGVTKKTLFLEVKDIPLGPSILPPPPPIIPESCLTVFPLATSQMPAGWR